MNIIITRHGETNKNIGNFSDDRNYTGLNHDGEIQIQKLTKRLQLYKIDTIISSPVQRCIETANIINKTFKTNIIYDELIKERNNGVYADGSNIPWDDLEGDFIHKKAPEGESLLMVRNRANKFNRKIKTKYFKEDSTILIISHGGFIKNFIGNILKIGIKDSIMKFYIYNASFSEIQFTKNSFKIITLNDTSHLK